MSGAAYGATARTVRRLAALELRRIVPWAGLAVGLGALAPLAGAFVDQVLPRLGAGSPAPPMGGVAAVPDALLGLLEAVLALGVVGRVRPFEHAPADFLGALPLAAGPVRAGRLLACAAVLLIVPLAHGVASSLAAAASLVSLDAASAPLGGALVRTSLLLALALLLAPARRLGWVALGGLGLAAAEAHIDGARPALDPFVTPVGLPAAGWLLAAVALGVVAWRTTRQGEALARLTRPVADGDPWPRANARLGAALAATLLGAAGLRLVEPLTAAASAQDEVIRTRRYVLTYPVQHAAAARALARQADVVHDAVCDLLGADVPAEAPPLAVTLEPPTEPRPQDDPCERVTLDGSERHALAHLTAHRLLGAGHERLRTSRSSTGLFEEGLARTASWRATDGDPFWSRFQAAVVHSRRLLSQPEVWDVDALERTRGREAVGAIGEAFVEALVHLHGPRAPADALAALDRRLAEGKRGAALWEAVLGDLGTTPAAAWEELLVVIEDSASADPRSHIALPRLRLMEEAQEDPTVLRLVAVPDGRGVPPGWDVVCRVIEDEATNVPTAALRLGPDSRGCHVFVVHGSSVAFGGARPRVQLGLRAVRPAPLAGVLWEDWLLLPDPSAQN